jgi:Ribosome biogenesis protein Nop16
MVLALCSLRITALQNRSWKRYDPNPKISDPIIKKHWDASKSPSVNLREMGLVATPNRLPIASQGSATEGNRGPDSGAEASKKSCVIELYDVPESDNLQRRDHPLEEGEEAYMARCMAKHGDDYASMFRDIKTNRLQHTEARLRKLGARYLLLAPEQRRVDVPDRVQPLVAFPS